MNAAYFQVREALPGLCEDRITFCNCQRYIDLIFQSLNVTTFVFIAYPSLENTHTTRTRVHHFTAKFFDLDIFVGD